MIQILTICSGNIARSPLAEQYLRLTLEGLPLTVSSAGTIARPGDHQTDGSQDVAAELGIPEADLAAHRARRLTETVLEGQNLVLGLSREHRKAAVELSPAHLRSAFTPREFARLAEEVTDAELLDAANVAGTDPEDRLRAALQLIGGVRGTVAPPADPADDDVADPAGRGEAAYVASAQQLIPALDQIVRVIRVTLT
ncbi:hypothetical protein GCM10009808_00260 [Microbacterium sediminicola]|uniref:Phosphotyrosine protein phosphatase I domain-containing protein n=1 Tax=Microbacterium sediminicola TaxID=415210 RepID=A0ABP4TGI4_9MICO